MGGVEDLRPMARNVRAAAAVAATVLLLALPVLVARPAVDAAPAPELRLLGSVPAADEEVARAPRLARAVFNRPVEDLEPRLVVVDADGERVDAGVEEPPSPAVIDASLPSDLPAGEYVAHWRVEVGGEPMEGAWRFHVLDDPAAASEASGAEAGGRSRGPAAVVAAVLALAVGAATAWRVAVGPERSPWTARRTGS